MLLNKHNQLGEYDCSFYFLFFIFLYRKWIGHVVIFQKNVPVKYLKTNNTVTSFSWIFKTRNTPGPLKVFHYENVCGKEATNRLHLLERTVLLLRSWYGGNKPKRVLQGIDIKISIWDHFWINLGF